MSETSANNRGAFVVIAEASVKPGSMAAFPEAASDDARHSIADEPGCRQFDVVAVECEANAVAFYEVYEDRAAFDRHREGPYLKRFQAACPSLVLEERPVRFAGRHALG